MPTLLDIPVELRSQIYDILLSKPLTPQSRGVIAITEPYVIRDLPLLSYLGLLRTCRQLYHEFKRAIQHAAAAKTLTYAATMTFSHGRPFFSLVWNAFPALYATITCIRVNVDLRTQEPLTDPRSQDPIVPDEHELALLIEEMPNNFAEQVFGYIAVLLKALARLLAHGDDRFRVLYTECITLNLRTPTEAVLPAGHINSIHHCSRVPVDREEARELHDTMQDTLKATSRWFEAFDAEDCGMLAPLIQVGVLRFETEGEVWAEGHNLVLPGHKKRFHWLLY
jgi:hypothetical protein